MADLTSPNFILFKEDWKKWPSAIPDTSTSNKSALEMCKLLKAMGVENHLWPIALINPSLRGVDPFSETLTIKQMTAIILECSINPWYFFREVARAPASGGSDPIRLRFNRGNCYLWWGFFNHLNVILTQPRQTGKSLSTDELMSYLLEVYCRSTKISLITKDEKLRIENTDRLRSILDCLPPYLKNRTSRDRCSSELIEVKQHSNTYTAYLCQKSEDMAHGLGRGASCAILQHDEPPFQANFGITYGVIIGSMGAFIDNAKAVNGLYGTIMTTTAAKKNTKSGMYFYQIVENSALWSEAFYDCKDIVELHLTIERASRYAKVNLDGQLAEEDDAVIGAASVYGCFSHRQLGYTDEWLRQVISRNKNPVAEDINRDFFNISTNGGERHPLDQDVLDAMIASKAEVLYTEIVPTLRYTIRWYIEKDAIDYEMNSRQVILGVDMSEGIGKDFITIVFMDTASSEVLAACTVKEANIVVFSYWFCSLLVRFPKTVAVIERKNMGVPLIDACLDYLPTVDIDPFKRLFNRIVQEKDDHQTKQQIFDLIKTPMNRRSRDVYTKFKALFGYNTSGSGAYSRDILYETTLNAAARRAASGVNDAMLIEQISALVVKDGRIDHRNGLHDDLVIGWLLCLWFMYSARNIGHYDLLQSRILSINMDANFDPEKAQQDFEQQAIRDELNKYLKLLEQEDDQHAVLHYEHHIRFLESQMIAQDTEVFTVGDLITKAAENRRKRKTTPKVRAWQNDDLSKYRDGCSSTL